MSTHAFGYFGGTAGLLLVRDDSEESTEMHTGERNVMVMVVDRRGRWSRFDRINLAYSAAWRVVTGSNDIF